MMHDRSRVRIRLTSQAEVMDFIQHLCGVEDCFSIENHSGMHRVNAKSIIGVLYTVFDFAEEMYLVNESHDGQIPDVVSRYLMPA